MHVSWSKKLLTGSVVLLRETRTQLLDVLCACGLHAVFLLIHIPISTLVTPNRGAGQPRR
jgi:hypothetical protein